MSVSDILDKLNNDTDSNIINLTSSKIKTMKNNMLQKLQLPRNELKNMHKKLKDYRYCNDMTDLQSGNYLRWISLKDPDNLKLTKPPNMIYYFCLRVAFIRSDGELS